MLILKKGVEMGFSCFLGHTWNGCKCSVCGKTRDVEHDWSSFSDVCLTCGKKNINMQNINKDSEKSNICGKEPNATHNWQGCKCTKCGLMRDEGHDWSYDCEECRACGKTRNKGHKWDRCMCSLCGKTRDEGHDWSKDCVRCSKCGKTRDYEHNWVGCKCIICGKNRNEGHEFSKDSLTCSKCGKQLFSTSDMVLVEGGTFRMGANRREILERPVHTVTVDSFLICNHQVTQAEWETVMGSNPSTVYNTYNGKEWVPVIKKNSPVTMVSWYDCIEFCNKLSLLNKLQPCYSGSKDSIVCDFSATGFRLPTEAEWEFAAKGGNLSKRYTYSGSDFPEDVAWFQKNSGSGTPHDVMTLAPNELGLFDMSGNVFEWCWDGADVYKDEEQHNPKGLDTSPKRVLRGGSSSSPIMFYANGPTQFDNCRIDKRSFCPPDYVHGDPKGLRLVRSEANKKSNELEIEFSDGDSSAPDNSLDELISSLKNEMGDMPESMTGFNLEKMKKINLAGGHKASEEEINALIIPLNSIPRMQAFGYDIEPFIPSLHWIKATIMQCFGQGDIIQKGKYSFSTLINGIYRMPLLGFSYGLSMGEIVRKAGVEANWDMSDETIDGIPVVTVYLENAVVYERSFPIENVMCRSIYFEPHANTYHLNLLWISKNDSTKVVYDHNYNKWLE